MILKSTVSLLIHHWINLRVVLIPGSDNVVADTLSWFQNDCAISACPDLFISAFTPPQFTMGLPEKWSRLLTHPGSPKGSLGP
jgi:hypothetical protein